MVINGNTLTRRQRDPFTSVQLPTPFGRLFDVFLTEPSFLGLTSEGKDSMDTLPLDISETETEVRVRASLPGFKRDEVSIEVDEGVLCITAEHEEATEETGGEGEEKWVCRERSESRLARTVPLPAGVDQDKAEAELRDGVLTLRMPKAVKSNRRRIAIGS